MKIIGFIPVRMNSSRFPGKPLAKICQISMIEHIYHRCSMSDTLDEVWVATCDNEIVEVVNAFGGKAIMTSNLHERCTDRIAEAAKKINTDADIIVNIQGDEPLVNPRMIDLVVQPLLDDNSLQTAHLVRKITSIEEFNDPNEVKVVFDPNWNTLYCSREPIPSVKKVDFYYDRWKQVCIIPFRCDFLYKFNDLPQTPLEKIESVDMMRAVEHGYSVKCVESEYKTIGVDTPKDLEYAEMLMAEDSLYCEYAQLVS